MGNNARERGERARLWLVIGGAIIGGAAWLAGAGTVADTAWAATTVVALLPAAVETVRGLLHREAGVDVVAVVAMAGALLLGEMAAGAILALMLTGGEALERHAAARARRELSALLERAPRVAHRETPDGVSDVSVEEVSAGDLLVVKGGEVVPTDGSLTGDRAVLDTSALTGEAEPVEVAAGDPILSGSVNAGSAFRMRATATAEQSTYAGIVRLVREATESRAPFVRLADRYAGRFVLVTFVFATGAWLVSGSAVRALAVLVVATPCPLILAAPAAVVGGLSTAARHGIIVKGGGALEALAQVRVALLDKTGTITTGRPKLVRIHAFGGHDATAVLQAAASLEQASVHPFAPAIVTAARERGLSLAYPQDVEEVLGAGIGGSVEDRKLAIGRLEWVTGGRMPPVREIRAVRRRVAIEGTSAVFVTVDGSPAAALVLEDEIRPESVSAIRALRRSGIGRVVMVSGDRPEVADLVGDSVGVDQVLAEYHPDDKVGAVTQARSDGPVVMVGDGINDAPALAAADVGVAMGARGATAASEAADVVLTADRLEGLAHALRIARRTRAIALQSVIVGMGLSVVAMGFAAAGLIAPVGGALLQEGIDLAVILNALRTLREPRGRSRRIDPAEVPMEILAEHRHVSALVDELTAAAAALDEEPADEVRAELERLRRFLEDDVLPHELREEREVYPVLGRLYGEEDPTPPMARSHREIARLIRLFGRLLDELPPGELAPEDLHDLRRILYGLHAVLNLHNALENELYAELQAAVRQPA